MPSIANGYTQTPARLRGPSGAHHRMIFLMNIKQEPFSLCKIAAFEQASRA
jgi:hypothetical protein